MKTQTEQELVRESILGLLHEAFYNPLGSFSIDDGVRQLDELMDRLEADAEARVAEEEEEPQEDELDEDEIQMCRRGLMNWTHGAHLVHTSGTVWECPGFTNMGGKP